MTTTKTTIKAGDILPTHLTDKQIDEIREDISYHGLGIEYVDGSGWVVGKLPMSDRLFAVRCGKGLVKVIEDHDGQLRARVSNQPMGIQYAFERATQAGAERILGRARVQQENKVAPTIPRISRQRFISRMAL